MHSVWTALPIRAEPVDDVPDAQLSPDPARAPRCGPRPDKRAAVVEHARMVHDRGGTGDYLAAIAAAV